MVEDKKRVLIVDDIAINRMLLVEIVDLLGYYHSEARNGKEAIDKLQKDDYFMVLMDVEMPVMNGIEATKYIKKMPYPFNETLVVGVTAHDPKMFSSDFENAGFDGFITKPYTSEKVEMAIESYLKLHK